MSILSSLSNTFSSLFAKKPTTQQSGYVNGQPIASFYTPQASRMQPKSTASTMPLTVPKPLVTPKPIVQSAPKTVAPSPTITPPPSTLSPAELLNNTQNAYRDSGLMPSMPAYNAEPPVPAAPPQEDYLKSFRDEILKYLMPSEQENQLQSDYNNLMSSRDLGVAEYRNRPVPMGIITGQTQALNEQAAIKAGTLKDKLALEQARRQAGLEASKFGYEAAKDQAAQYQPKEVGGNLVRLNPTTGKYESVYSSPQVNKPIEVNGQLVQLDPTTGKYVSVFGSPKQDLPASAQEYEYAVKHGYKGTYQQYQNEDANRKRSITNINNGTQTDRDRVLKTAAVTKARPELQRNIGRDGYVDPSVYLRLRADYAATIGDAAEFDATFSSLLSPYERARLGIGKAAGIDADDGT